MSRQIPETGPATYEYPTEPTSEGGSGEEQGNTINLLVTLVPHTHIEDASGDESTVDEAYYETDGEESGKVLGDARENANDAPDEGEGR